MFCTKCGAKIADGSRFCPTCGAQQPGEAPSGGAGASGNAGTSGNAGASGNAGTSGNAVRITAIVAAALVIVAIVGGVTVVLTSSGSNESAAASSSATEVTSDDEETSTSASSSQAAEEAAEEATEEEHYFENDYYYVDLPDDWDEYTTSYTVESDGTVLFYVAKGEDYYGGAYVYVLDASDDAPEAATKLGTSNGKVVYMMNVSAGFFADEYVSDNAQITLK